MKEIVILEAMSLAKPERREARKCLTTKLLNFLQQSIVRVGKSHYICSAKLKQAYKASGELRLQARHIRAFFMPMHKRLRLSILYNLAHRSNACFSLATGYDSRFSVYSQTKTSEMKQTVALPAQKAKQSLFVDRAIRAWKLYCRWLIITTIAAPNPMQEGGEA